MAGDRYVMSARLMGRLGLHLPSGETPPGQREDWLALLLGTGLPHAQWPALRAALATVKLQAGQKPQSEGKTLPLSEDEAWRVVQGAVEAPEALAVLNHLKAMAKR